MSFVVEPIIKSPDQSPANAGSSPDAPDLVRYEVTGEVATVTLDSPHNRNALSRRLVQGLFDALDRAGGDPGIKVVVIRSAGKVFCSGADLSEASAGSMEEGARAMVEMQRRIVALPQPVVVRLQGAVRAGGLGIVAAADIAIAEERTTFALTEVKLGLAPAVISLTVLPRMTSRAAAETCLRGEVFDAVAAARMGLVTRAVPAGDLDDEINATCASLASGAAQGLRETKKLLNRDLLARIDAHTDEMARLSARLFGSQEAREAMTAFLTRKK